MSKIEIYGEYDYILNLLSIQEDKKWIDEFTWLLEITTNKFIEVETLDEYFTLLERISNITDDYYRIYNCGKTIELFE